MMAAFWLCSVAAFLLTQEAKGGVHNLNEMDVLVQKLNNLLSFYRKQKEGQEKKLSEPLAEAVKKEAQLKGTKSDSFLVTNADHKINLKGRNGELTEELFS